MSWQRYYLPDIELHLIENPLKKASSIRETRVQLVFLPIMLLAAVVSILTAPFPSENWRFLVEGMVTVLTFVGTYSALRLKRPERRKRRRRSSRHGIEARLAFF